MKACYLLFDNGDCFEGFRFGADADIVGEAAFTTSAIGAVETLTDPSNAGQIMLFSAPAFGNEGTIIEDAVSDRCHMRGVVVREWCAHPSNARASGTIDAYMKKHGVAGLCGIDTRAVLKAFQKTGLPRRAAIVGHMPENIGAFFGAEEHVRAGTVTPVVHRADNGAARIALMDIGARSDMIRRLTERGVTVFQLPLNTGAEEIFALHTEGLILSDGPGDPKSYPDCVETIKKLLGKLPILGIGLGHLLLALAAGGDTERLALSHRGANLPVRCAKTGRVYITEQNHGYAVRENLPPGAEISYAGLNDGSVEGLYYPGLRARSVAFAPKPGPAARDLTFLYDFYKL